MLCRQLWPILSRVIRSAILLVFVVGVTATIVQAQTFTVLHSFSGGPDGANPLAGLSMDRAGNLYGTASMGGLGYGTIYKLARHGSSWTLNPLYQFHGLPDGFFPEARVTIAADGTLYGTTFYGGIAGSGCLQGGPAQCGTVFHLQPAPHVCTTPLCSWTETQLHEFNNYPSVFWPNFGDLTFDRAGNLYGVAFSGGHTGGGVYQMTPASGGWTETDIYLFPHNGVNFQPVGGVIADSAGNLYGTTYGAPTVGTYGSVYELTPSGSGWTLSTLYTFQNGSDGGAPRADLIMDSAGNLYGTTSVGGPGVGGTVWELSPSGSGWNFSVIYSFPGSTFGPFSPVLMDAAGNLYGTTLAGGAFQQGSVFKLTHSDGGWTYTSLHDFTGDSDGRSPYGHLIFDASGNLYGTAGWGGSSGNGVVWEITP
jgi:uncharacterized repeat protein (TIGR03803 family)